MEDEGYRMKDWMDLPQEEGTYVISLPEVTNILSALAALTINLEGDEVSVPAAIHLRHPIEAQPVTSVSVSSQSTYVGCRLRKMTLLKMLECYFMLSYNAAEWYFIIL